MDILSMLKREPFYDVLFETIRSYYLQVHGVEVSVGFNNKYDSKKLYLYFIPSFIAGKKVTGGMREFLYSEYNIRGSVLKYLLGKIAVFVSTASHGLAAGKCFFVEPAAAVPEAIFILPCNRSVRFFDFEHDCVDCMAKDNYKIDFMVSQLSFRLSADYPFVPRVLEYGPRWYRERIMRGKPLARVRNQLAYEKGTSDALAYMGVVAKDTLQYEACGEYAQSLGDNIKNMLSELSNDDCSKKAFHGYIEYAVRGAEQCSLNIPTVLSHGDLQGGNIWISEKGETIIYDWETNSRRSVWYDPATLLWKLHSGAFVIDIRDMVLKDDRFLINDEKKDYSANQLSAIAFIIILENLAFYLTDILQLPEQLRGQCFQHLSRNLHNRTEMRSSDGA